MGSLLVSGIQANYDGLDTQGIMESRMIMGSGDEEDEAAARSLFKTNTLGNSVNFGSRAFQLPNTTQGDFSAI